MYVAAARPVRVARFLGYADLHSPLCAAEHRQEAALGLQEALGRGSGRCRVLIAEKLPGEQGWDRLLGGRVIATQSDPVLRIEGRSWEEFLASKRRHFRSQVRRQEKKALNEHGLAYRLTTDREQLDQDISTLFRLHQARFGDESTGIFEGERGEMQREVITAAFERGWLRLWIAEVDGEPAAAYYGWRYAGSEWFFQSGRDPRFDEVSAGAVLLAHVVRDVCEAGLAEFRFLAGSEAYKTRYADGDYEPQTRVLGSGLAGRTALLGAAALLAMPESGRARAMRLIR
jgi:CelD/BcsL family acetyltransferase involved in cellulose biosynthesis